MKSLKCGGEAASGKEWAYGTKLMEKGLANGKEREDGAGWRGRDRASDRE